MIRRHTKYFTDGIVSLRPMTEEDLPLLCRWNGDEDVLHFCEGDVEPYSEEEVASFYETISRNADCFMICAEDRVIGECRLRPIPSPFSEPLRNSTDCKQISIMIGEKDFWGKEFGSRAIGLLCRFVFENTSCTHLFAEGIFDYNERARKAFERNGFKIYKSIPSDGEYPGELTMFKGSVNKIF